MFKISSLAVVVLFATCCFGQQVPSLPTRFRNSYSQALASLRGLRLAQYTPVNVTVFFESHCPDSRDFIEDQLYPTVTGNILPSQIYTLDFVAYGNAYTTYNPTSRSYSFSCQHGADECLGNIYETCFDYIVRDSNQSVPFFNCMFQKIFSGSTSSQAAFLCTNSLKNNVPLYNAWLGCNSTVGPALHAYNGVRTNALSPAHSFIPWITFDSMGSSSINSQARFNFAETVVKYWFNKNMP